MYEKIIIESSGKKYNRDYILKIKIDSNKATEFWV